MFNKEFDTFVYYLNERERIRQKKLAGEKYPWTNDSILSSFSFTNVLREHDRTSQWVIENWYSKHHNSPLEDQLINCAIFRYFGTMQFAQAIGWTTGFSEPRAREIKNIATERLLSGEIVFTGAYVITNQGIAAPKQEVVIDVFITPFWNQCSRMVEIAHGSYSWRAVCEHMKKIQGFGGTGFMAKEVLQDAMFTAVLPRDRVVDRLDWSPAGPGAQRGLNRLTGRRLDSSVSEKAAIEEMKWLRAKALPLFEPHMEVIVEQWDLHAVQFALCELDKYIRVREGEGRPRKRYRPK